MILLWTFKFIISSWNILNDFFMEFSYGILDNWWYLASTFCTYIFSFHTRIIIILFFQCALPRKNVILLCADEWSKSCRVSKFVCRLRVWPPLNNFGIMSGLNKSEEFATCSAYCFLLTTLFHPLECYWFMMLWTYNILAGTS